MVKLLAELHGGSVAVESEAGAGSCFTVWLPVRAPAEAVGTSAKAPTGSAVKALAGERIALVVEDDVESAELIRLQLEAEGFTVLYTASAETALLLARQHPLSLIAVDIMLPDLEGCEFFSRLKQTPDLRRIPIVIISGMADPERGFSLGAAAVLEKPVLRQDLYQSLVDLGLFPFSPSQKLTVLLVDDDPKAVDLIALRMSGLASSVLRANGGREAIDVARKELPDLIVLDLMMPDINGFDVMAALSESEDTARIPILVVTAKEITIEDRARLDGHVTRIIGKTGFDTARFLAEVRRAVSGRESFA
jgi:CheY-like chemotaxis protein